jgi:hypothetical protein
VESQGIDDDESDASDVSRDIETSQSLDDEQEERGNYCIPGADDLSRQGSESHDSYDDAKSDAEQGHKRGIAIEEELDQAEFEEPFKTRESDSEQEDNESQEWQEEDVDGSETSEGKSEGGADRHLRAKRNSNIQDAGDSSRQGSEGSESKRSDGDNKSKEQFTGGVIIGNDFDQAKFEKPFEASESGSEEEVDEAESHDDSQGADFDESQASEERSADYESQSYDDDSESLMGQLTGNVVEDKDFDEDEFEEPFEASMSGSEEEGNEANSHAHSQADFDNSQASEERSAEHARQRLEAKRNGKREVYDSPGANHVLRSSHRIGSHVNTAAERDDGTKLSLKEEFGEAEFGKVGANESGSEQEDNLSQAEDLGESDASEDQSVEEDDIGESEGSEDESALQRAVAKRNGSVAAYQIPRTDDISGYGNEGNESHRSEDDKENQNELDGGIAPDEGEVDEDEDDDEFDEAFEGHESGREQEDDESRAESQGDDDDESEDDDEQSIDDTERSPYTTRGATEAYPIPSSDDVSHDGSEQSDSEGTEEQNEREKAPNCDAALEEDFDEDNFEEAFEACESDSERDDDESLEDDVEESVAEDDPITDEHADRHVRRDESREAYDIPDVDDISRQHSESSALQDYDKESGDERQPDVRVGIALDKEFAADEEDIEEPLGVLGEQDDNMSQSESQSDDFEGGDSSDDLSNLDHHRRSERNEAIGFEGNEDESSTAGSSNQGTKHSNYEMQHDISCPDEENESDDGSYKSQQESPDEDIDETKADQNDAPYGARPDSSVVRGGEYQSSNDKDDPDFESEAEESQIDESSDNKETDSEPDDNEQEESNTASLSAGRGLHYDHNDGDSHSQGASDEEPSDSSYVSHDKLAQCQSRNVTSAQLEWIDTEEDEENVHVVTDHEMEEGTDDEDASEQSNEGREFYPKTTAKALDASDEVEFHEGFDSSDRSFGDEDLFPQDNGDGFTSLKSFATGNTKVDDVDNAFDGFGDHDDKDDLKFAEVETKTAGFMPNEQKKGDRSLWIASVWGIVDQEDEGDDNETLESRSPVTAESSSPMKVEEKTDANRTTWLASVMGVDDDKDEEGGGTGVFPKTEAISSSQTLQGRQANMPVTMISDTTRPVELLDLKPPSESEGIELPVTSASRATEEENENDSLDSFDQHDATTFDAPTQVSEPENSSRAEDAENEDDSLGSFDQHVATFEAPTHITESEEDSIVFETNNHGMTPKALPQSRHSQLDRIESNPSLEGGESFYDEDREEEEDDEADADEEDGDEESLDDDDDDEEASFEESSYESQGFHIMETVPEGTEEDATTFNESGDNLSISASERTRSEHIASFMILEGLLEDDDGEASASRSSYDEHEPKETEEIGENDDDREESEGTSYQSQEDDEEEDEEESEEFEETSDQEENEEDDHYGSFNGSHDYLEPVLEQSDEDEDEEEDSENGSRETMQGTSSEVDEEMEEVSDEERSEEQVSVRGSEQGTVDESAEEGTESEDDGSDGNEEPEEEYEDEEDGEEGESMGEQRNLGSRHVEEDDEEEGDYDDGEESDDLEESEEEEGSAEEEESEEPEESEEREEDEDEEGEEEEDDDEEDDEEDDEDDDTVAMEEAMAAMTDPEVMAEMAKIMMDDPEFQAQLAALDPSYVNALAEMMKDA